MRNEAMAEYLKRASIYNFPDPTPQIFTKEAFYERYAGFFIKESKVYCKILERTSVGKFAFDREYLTGFLDNSVKECIAIYEVEDKLIRNIWFVK